MALKVTRTRLAAIGSLTAPRLVIAADIKVDASASRSSKVRAVGPRNSGDGWTVWCAKSAKNEQLGMVRE